MIKVTRACKISKKELKKELRLSGAKKIEERYKTMRSTATGVGEFLFPMIKMRRRK